MAQVWWKE